MEDYRLEQSGQEVQNILNSSTPQSDLDAEILRAGQAEQALDSKIDAEETRAKAAEKQNADDIDAEELARQQADQTLDGKIGDEEIRAKAAEKQNADDIDALEAAIQAILLLIPSAATSLNQLADKAFVNSSIATASATFRGTYNLVTDLSLTVSATHTQIATALGGAVSGEDNNDYAFVQVPTSDATPTQIAKTERYKFNGTAWEYEYDLNNSGYTAAQWAAINSGITAALVSKLSALPTNSELTTALGVLTEGIAAINAKIPSVASSSNKLVDNSSMVAYIGQIIDAIDATFNVTSTDGHVTVQITQVNGVITNVAVTTSDIASASSLTLVTGRVTDAEANIVSLGGRMTTAETDIDDLQQLYNNLQQSAPQVIEPTDTWPVAVADRSATVIYRVVDRVNTPPQYYSDYMFRASDLSGQPVLMARYDNAIDPRPKKGSQNLVTSGGVFDNMGALDVSELNATENPHTLAIYADLSAALAAIPSDYQKGGMSIKFVSSVDNKYVQYRLMSDNWSVVVANWQGVDEEPTAVSDNLVKSGGVAGSINGIYKQKASFCGYYAALSTGNLVPATDAINGVLFPVSAKKQYHIGFKSAYNSAQFYSDNPITGSSTTLFIESVSIDENGNFMAPDGAKYVVIDTRVNDFVEDYSYFIFKDSQDILNSIHDTKNKNGLPWFMTNFLDPDDPDVQSGMFNASGAIDTSQAAFYVSGYIPLNEKFPVLVLGYDGVITTLNCNNNYYDANKQLIKTVTQGSTGNVVNWFEGVAYVRFSVWRNHKAQVESGTMPTNYHPFQKDVWHLLNVNGVQSAIDERSLSIGKTKFAHKNLFNPDDPDIITTGYLQVDGTLLTTSSFGVSGYIPFTKDMKYLICSQNGTPSRTNAALCYYDSNKQFLKGELLIAINGIATWFEGVAYIRWSFITYNQNYYLNQVEIGTEVTEYVPYEDGFKIAENILALRKNNSILGEDAFYAHSDELASARLSISDAPAYLTKNDKISFYAGFDSFSSVWVGVGLADGGAFNRFLEITGTYMSLLKGSSGVDSVAHGLTISTFIKVIISQNDQGSCHVILQTLEGKFEHDFANWGYMSLGTPFVQSVNCTLTDVSLSYTNSDLKKSVWVIGDSYTVFDRWPQYLKEWGFWNFALFGLPGGNSDHMYVDLYKALKKYMPKYLVWLVGMNDNNSNKTMDYKNILEALSYLCNSVGSELIVGITPTVATINHDDKRAFILDKGYRYIDVYKAVGTNSNGQWYAGYLDSDGVHPSSLGSQAIATQILVDFPEIMQY